MKSERFFKWIWNFNGLVAFIAISIGTIFISYELVSSLFKEEYIEPLTLNLAEDEAGEEKWSLGHPNKIGESDFYYIPLESEKLDVESKGTIVEGFGGSRGYYTKTRSKNALFLNGKTNNSKWLFKSVNQLITDIKVVSSYENSRNSKALALSYEIINSDTNQDGKFDSLDKRTFALSKIDGSNYIEIIEGYNKIVESNLNLEGNLFVVFINNNEVFSMIVNLSTFKIIDKKPLPRVGNS
ncbi:MULTISPECIES: hypothetical protein [unclassified Pseudoalteromonas]|uniref:hypothetical protein n=1 Tax=unclassified Pseudoalteromonas TaxID=194690 RepID=UPI0018CEEE36|nr:MULTISPECIES: hypothetical protein [unclassified Pseudoalteromonas]MBH0043463.1 hypothetical protein [Pseudoalteromonas sp. SWXJZ10B]MBH0077674.1 hypothetical protein [Pseudoalteromonas sp. SWYJ118]